jgi:hypothetical protein
MSVEIKPGQCWFATMPYKQDSRSRAGCYVLTDVRLKQGIRHSVLMWTCVETRCLKIITVTALQIADRTDRFGHDNKRFAIRYRCPRDFPWHLAYLSSETNVSNIIILLTGAFYSHYSRPNQMGLLKYSRDNCFVLTGNTGFSYTLTPQILAEKLKHLLPGIHRLLRSIHVTMIIPESMTCAIISMEFVVLSVLLQLFFVLVHLFR